MLFRHFQIKLTLVYLLIFFVIWTFSRQIYDSIVPSCYWFFKENGHMSVENLTKNRRLENYFIIFKSNLQQYTFLFFVFLTLSRRIYNRMFPHFSDCSKKMFIGVVWFWQKLKGRRLFRQFQIKPTLLSISSYVLYFLTFWRQIYGNISSQYNDFSKNMVMRHESSVICLLNFCSKIGW